MAESFLKGKVILHRGDCLEVLAALEPDSLDACVCDPPYHLTSIVKRFGQPHSAPVKVDRFCGHSGADKGASPYARSSKGFMGKQWDGGDIAFRPETWAAILRVLKPGAHLIAFSGTRTYHRMACAIEDAGFEIRDQIGWCYGSGFPKSRSIWKDIGECGPSPNKGRWKGGQSFGAGKSMWVDGEISPDDRQPQTDEQRQWQGWGTALKPAWEPIVLARKPLSESSIAANVLRHGTGGINIDSCRIGTEQTVTLRNGNSGGNTAYGRDERVFERVNPPGRWPANLIHDGSEEVVRGFPDAVGMSSQHDLKTTESNYFGADKHPGFREGFNDSGSAARFFYTAKADADDRLGSKHPTVKPLDLMQYLVRLVTPRGGTVIDPFAGTGTTGEAAWREGAKAVLIEREAEYQEDIVRRMGLADSGAETRRAASTKQEPVETLPMFASLGDTDA